LEAGLIVILLGKSRLALPIWLDDVREDHASDDKNHKP
jgi:hypothetical protein